MVLKFIAGDDAVIVTFRIRAQSPDSLTDVIYIFQAVTSGFKEMTVEVAMA